MENKLLITISGGSYSLLDSGNGEKLERYGEVVLRRPDPQALWLPFQNKEIWQSVQGKFSRNGTKTIWKIDKSVPKEWTINFEGLNFVIRPTSFKHVGLFPEQSSHWKWTEKIIKNAMSKPKMDRPVSVLNLFAYTGGATLSCVRAGAEVCHVDGSKIAVQWAKENARASGLDDKPIRWIVEDCLAFMKREIKRGRKYDGIIMDPPAFGHGPHDELWKIEEDFQKLLGLANELLSDNPLFLIISGYSSGYSPTTYEQTLRQVLGKSGDYESGELAIEAENKSHVLPCGMYTRWKR